MEKVRTGLIGCGKVGDFHARAFASLPQSDFRAVCSSTKEKAEAFAARYGVHAYTDVEEMCRKEHLDCVSVCTPHPVHAAPAVTAAKCGCNVLVEKPLAARLSDCDEIIRAGEENHVKIGTIVQRRFYRPCQRIRKTIDEGKIGTPIIGTVQMFGWRDKAYYDSDPWRGSWKGEGGGVLVNQAPHQLDLLLWYMGEAEEVYGLWKNYNHPYIEVEDTAVAVVKFKNGGIGNIIVSNSQNPALFGKVHIYGSNGASIGVQTDGGAMFVAGMSSIAEPPVNDLWTVPGEEDMLAVWKKEDSDYFNSIDSTHHYHVVQIEDFLNAIIEDRRPLVDGYDGRKTVELIEAIYRSTESGCPVKLPLK